MVDFPLPPRISIRHKFLSLSPELTLFDAEDKPFIRVHCPSLRITRRANVYSVTNNPGLLFWIAPVFGLKWNLMVNQPDDEIVGVLQRETDPETGKSAWTIINPWGRRLFVVRAEEAAWRRLAKKLVLFTSRTDVLMAGKQRIGTYVSHAGMVNEDHVLTVAPDMPAEIDPRLVLAAAISLTGIFNHVFT